MDSRDKNKCKGGLQTKILPFPPKQGDGVGGEEPAKITSCLKNVQQMGEGWVGGWVQAPLDSSLIVTSFDKANMNFLQYYFRVV